MRKPCAILLSCMLAFPVAARAGIVIDDAPPDAAPKPQATPDTVAAAKPSPAADTLLFANKDVLHGTFLGCDKAGLRWRSTAAKEPLVFQTAALAEMKYGPRTPPAGATPGAHTVHLINGDELPGVIVSLDEKTLLLDTWYAGRLAIPRGMVRAVTRTKKNNIIYQGPNGLGEWTAGEEEPDEEGRTGKCWAFKNGSFTASSYGSIWRDMKLPARSDIGFDLTLPAGEPDLDMFIYCGNDGDAGDCYLFQFGLDGVSLTRVSNGHNTQMKGTDGMDGNAMRGEKVRINIRADKEAKKLRLLVNGKVAGEWTDPAGFAGTGTFLKFTSQIEQGALKMGNIKVTTWEDEPADATDAVAAKPLKTDELLLENHDRVDGKLEGITNGKLVITSNYPGANPDLERVEEIDFAGDGEARAEKTPGSPEGVRAYFAGGGNATVEFESWDGKQVTASSPDFGKAVFSPGAFQLLQFQPGATNQGGSPAPEAGDPSPPSEKTDPAAADTLRFASKDVLHGILLGCSGADVRWQSPAAKAPFVFETTAIADVKLGAGKQVENAGAQPVYFVQMANGDQIPGTLVSLDGRNLLLDTSYAGRLTIPRDAVKCITTLKDHKTFFYQGPQSMEGWTIDLCNGEDEFGKPVKRKPDWTYSNGAFISTGMDVLKRAVELPAKCSIEFDLDVQSAAFSDSTPDLELEIGDYKDCYRLDLYNEEDHVAEDRDVNKNEFLLRRVSHGKDGATKWEEGKVNGSGARREKTHIDLRIDKEARTLWLFINGKLARQWVDKEAFPTPGNMLSFDTEDSKESYTKISNIKLSEWNGKLDARPETGPHKAPQDGVTMENRDSLSGKIKGITDGKIIMATAYSDATVPLDHVTEINLASAGAAPAKQRSGDFRASLAGGGSVTFKLESWDANHTVVVTSPDFGKASFSAGIFLSLQFKIDKQPPGDETDTGDPDGKENDSADP